MRKTDIELKDSYERKKAGFIKLISNAKQVPIREARKIFDTYDTKMTKHEREKFRHDELDDYIADKYPDRTTGGYREPITKIEDIQKTKKTPKEKENIIRLRKNHPEYDKQQLFFVHKRPNYKTGIDKTNWFSKSYETYDEWEIDYISKHGTSGKYYKRISEGYKHHPDKNLNQLRGK